MNANEQSPELLAADLEALKAQADLLGVKYHPSIGADALREKVKAAKEKAAADEGLKNDEDAKRPGDVLPAPAVETENEKRLRLKNEAFKLVRIRVVCMNPAKKDWSGEIITGGNSAVGSVKKFVPFNGAEDGWHVPHIIYQVMKERRCPVYLNGKSANGVTIRQHKMIPEFAIEVLPDLSAAELHDLAQRQAMAGNIS